MGSQGNRKVIMSIAALFLLSSPALAQKYAPSFPRDGAKTVLENDIVTIWDVTWEKGKPTAMQEHRVDQVTVTLTQGTVKVTRPDKTWFLEQTNPGSVKFEPKGTVAAEEGISDNPRRALVVEIKSYAQPKLSPEVAQGLKEAKEKGIPGQFPRPGAFKLFETDHLIVWDDKWPLDGKMGPLHAHYDTDIGLFFEAGELSPSIRPVGFANFNAPRIPPHQEMATKGPPRAIFVQFK
jgi:quercetin dioxygenase-like cupin family protein